MPATPRSRRSCSAPCALYGDETGDEHEEPGQRDEHALDSRPTGRLAASEADARELGDLDAGEDERERRRRRRGRRRPGCRGGTPSVSNAAPARRGTWPTRRRRTRGSGRRRAAGAGRARPVIDASAARSTTATGESAVKKPPCAFGSEPSWPKYGVRNERPLRVSCPTGSDRDREHGRARGERGDEAPGDLTGPRRRTAGSGSGSARPDRRARARARPRSRARGLSSTASIVTSGSGTGPCALTGASTSKMRPSGRA